MYLARVEALGMASVPIKLQSHVPDRRNGGCGALIDNKIYFWGGQTEDKLTLSASDIEDEESSEEEDEVVNVSVPVNLPRPDDDDHPFEVFDIPTRTWTVQPTKALKDSDIPALGLGSTLTYHPGTRSLYLYSGWNEGNFDSEVYRVSVNGWMWKKLEQEATSVMPSPRYLTAVVQHGDKLCMFGGVGPEIVPGQDDGALYFTYIAHGKTYTFGWNNEYYEFDVNTMSWEAPLGPNAHRPPPVSAHAFVKFDRHRAVYFGGRRETGYTNDVYLFDLDRREFEGPMKPPLPSYPLPTARVFPTLTPLVHPELVGERFCSHGPFMLQRMVMLWGKKREQQICNEAWMLDMESFIWAQLDVGPQRPRAWHMVHPFYCQPNISTECQLVVFGGNAHIKGVSGDREDLADLRILTFGMMSLQNRCLSVIVEAANDRKVQSAEDLYTLLPAGVPKANKDQIKAAFAAEQNCVTETPRFSKSELCQ